MNKSTKHKWLKRLWEAMEDDGVNYLAPENILVDLIKTTPGDEGKWFATAKDLKLYDLALQLAEQSACEPKTLTRAARDSLEAEPEFAFGAAMAALRWLSEGGVRGDQHRYARCLSARSGGRRESPH